MTRLAGLRFTTSLVALLLGVFAARDANAQTVITGKVTNQQGAPIAGANISVPSLGIRADADDG